MKKGFTMIEILAVFTITAVILLVTVPLITGMLKKGDKTTYDEFEKTIFLATESYINDKELGTSFDKITYITIRDLLDSGFLKTTIINPYNNKKITDKNNKDIQIIIKKDEDNVLYYEMDADV